MRQSQTSPAATTDAAITATAKQKPRCAVRPHIPTKTIISDLRYLRLLSQKFPTLSSVATEIINLQAILHLPKPTEHFLADIHGEYEAFRHVLRTASGNIKRKVHDTLGGVCTEEEIHDLCTLIYYPRRRLALVRQKEGIADARTAPGEKEVQFYGTLLRRLIPVCRSVSKKYTRSKVRKSLPPEFAYIIEELLHEHEDVGSKQAYVDAIIRSIIDTRRAEVFVIELCNLIARLSVDRLHILGDIFDRGPAAYKILDLLSTFHDWDIQWGNHDVLWMGAAAGNAACAACAVRLSLRYANTATLEEGYGINLLPLARLAMDAYGDDPCEGFQPTVLSGENEPDEKTRRLTAQMHKAIAIIQFKLEAALYRQHPEWQMLDRIDVMQCDDRLTEEEADVVERLVQNFLTSPRLQAHIQTLLTHGSMYLITNGCLCFHASIPLNADGTLKNVRWGDGEYAGKALMQRIEMGIRMAFDAEAEPAERAKEIDRFWYLWCGPDSPLFDKHKMATYERYFSKDPATHVEEKGHYYLLRDQPEVCDRLMDAFNLTGTHRHIINGHVPVRAAKGENPVKAGGRLMVIDGGFARAYHATTGIAGYTLVYHSRGFQLVQHEPFTSTEDAIQRGTDIRSTTQIVEMRGCRMLVGDTDKGQELQAQIESLERLLVAYRRGILLERG